MSGLGFDIFARDKTAQAFNTVKSKVKSLDDSFQQLKKTAVLLGGGAAIFGWLKGAAEGAEHINDLSNRLGISAEVLSQYQLIASETGVELDSIAKGMQWLGKNSIEAAQGTGAARDALNQLGIDATTFKNLSIDDQFALVAEKIQGVQNPAERVSIAMTLMGRSGAEMLQVMQEGGAGLEEMQAKADALGITLNNTQTGAIDTMMDSIGNLGLQAMALGQHFIAQLAPAITFVADALQVVLAGAIVIVRDGFKSMVQVILNAIGHIANGMAWLTDKFSALPGTVGESFQSISDSLRNYGDILTNVSAETDTAATAQNKHNLELRDTSDLLDQVNGKMPNLKKTYDNVGKATARTASQAKDDFDSLDNQISRTADNAKDRMLDALVNMEGGFESFRDVADSALKQISKSILDNLINSMFQANNTLPWLQGAGGMGGGGGFGGFLNTAGSFLNMFGGFFADGGTLRPGQWGVVGENGMEIASAGSSPLTITPLSDANYAIPMAEGGNTTIIQKTYNIDARNAEAGVEQRILKVLKQVDQSVESRAVLAVANAKRRNPALI